MEFKSYADLEVTITKALPKLPRDIDLVVGIPRSGLAPASMIALYLNVPMTDLEGLFEKRLMGKGQRKLRTEIADDFFERLHHVLVVDDCVGSGTQLRAIKERIAAARFQHKFSFAVPHASPEGKPLVDFPFEDVPSWKHCFAWNVMHHPATTGWCFDMDGVLCRDCLPNEDDDGPKYETFLKTAQPLFLPSNEIGWIVTSRLEKYRSLTEAWLKRHGVRYRHLIMHPAKTLQERIETGGGGPFKGDFYKKVDSHFFIESNFTEAQILAGMAGKPVLCTDTLEVVRPSNSTRVKALLSKKPGAHMKTARRHLRQLRNAIKNR